MMVQRRTGRIGSTLAGRRRFNDGAAEILVPLETVELC
jgi:hypothetical protein